MAGVVKVLIGLITLTWPVWVGLTLHSGHTSWLWASLSVVFAIQLIQRYRARQHWPWDALLSAVGFAGALLAWTLNVTVVMLWYPVLVNLGFLTLFAYSLKVPPTVIEKFARLMDPNLPEEGVRYTRVVTQVWCGFFIVNGSIAAGTVIFYDPRWWALWNGVLSYVAMGALFAGEWLYRKFIHDQ